MGQLALPLMIAQGVMGAGGALMEGKSQAAQYKYQAQVANNNAEIARQNQTNALLAGARDEGEHRMKVGRLRGAQKAQAAANGIDITGPTQELIDDTTEAEGDFDAFTLRYNAAREAHDERVREQNEQMQAKMYKKAAKGAKFKSYLGAANSLVGMGASIAGRKQ